MQYTKTGYKKYLDEDMITKLDYYFEYDVSLIQNRLVYYFMRYMGLRVGDACSLKLENIQFPFLVFVMQKTKRSLRLPIPLKMQNFLNSYVTLYKNNILKNNGFLAFSPRDDSCVKPGSIRVLFEHFRKKFGYILPYATNQRTGQKYFNITPHSLRHYVLSTLYKKSNYNLLLCRDFAGHRKASTTADIYIETTTPEDMRQYVDMI